MRFDSAIADRLTSLAFLVIGASMVYGGFVMDRLEVRQIHPASIPGLVPMFLGAALMLCAILLFLGATRAVRDPEGEGRVSFVDFGLAAAWSTLYAVVLVGHGLHFGVATAIYIAVFAAWFGMPREGGTRAKLRWSAIAVGFAAVMAAGVSLLFRYAFLVRLP